MATQSGTLLGVEHAEAAPGLLRLAASITLPPSALLHVVRLTPGHDADASGTHEPTTMRAAALTKLAKRLAVDVGSLAPAPVGSAAELLGVAQEKGVDLIVLGQQERQPGEAQVLAGFVREVMAGASCDVGMLVDNGLQRVQRVLVPYCRSPQDTAALAFGRRIAERTWAEIVLLHAIDPAADLARRRDADRVLEEVFRPHQAARSHVVFKVVRHADRTQAVLDELARGYDLLVLGADLDWGADDRTAALAADRILEARAASIVVMHRGT
jgi:nucleotide-binding universal stress UspA family protein